MPEIRIKKQLARRRSPAQYAVIMLLALAGSVAPFLQVFAATYYVDFDGGSDSAGGTTPESAWKNAPGDARAAGNSRSAVLSPGDTVLFKGGVVYRGAIRIPAGGSTGSPITYKGDGWGAEKAILDGSQLLAGWQPCASRASCGGNVNWQKIYFTSITIPSFLTNVPELALNIFQDDQPIIPAQAPKSPNRLYQSLGNYYSVPAGSVTATSLSDARLAGLGGPGLVGSYIYLYVSYNELVPRKILSYDSAAHTVTFSSASVYTSENTLYAVANNIADVLFNSPGEYYADPAAGRLYVWPLSDVDLTQSGKVTMSVRDVAIDLNSRSFISIEGFKIQKQTSDASSGGTAIFKNSSSDSSGIVIRNNEMTMLQGQGGGAVYFNKVTGAIIENNYLHDTLGQMRGIQTGGKNLIVRNNTLTRLARTPIFLPGAVDSEISGNNIGDSLGVHSNGISVYDNAANVSVFNNRVVNSNIAMTMQNAANIKLYNNIFDGSDNAAIVLASWGGMTGTNLIANNLIMGSSDNCSLYFLGGDGTSIALLNNFIDGGSDNLIAYGSVSNNIYTALCRGQAAQYGWSLASGELVETDLRKLFRDAHGGDFHLIPGSPAIDKAVPLAGYFAADFSGTPRPQGSGWDVGAYEFVPRPLPPNDLRVAVPSK